MDCHSPSQQGGEDSLKGIEFADAIQNRRLQALPSTVCRPCLSKGDMYGMPQALLCLSADVKQV